MKNISCPKSLVCIVMCNKKLQQKKGDFWVCVNNVKIITLQNSASGLVYLTKLYHTYIIGAN